MPETQRYLLTTHLEQIYDRTGLEPGLVNPQDPALTQDALEMGYWLICTYELSRHLVMEWVWTLSTLRLPADWRGILPYVDRRELTPELAQDLVRLVPPGATL